MCIIWNQYPDNPKVFTKNKNVNLFVMLQKKVMVPDVSRLNPLGTVNVFTHHDILPVFETFLSGPEWWTDMYP